MYVLFVWSGGYMSCLSGLGVYVLFVWSGGYMSCLSGLGVICLVCLGCLSFLPNFNIASVLYVHVFPCT